MRPGPDSGWLDANVIVRYLVGRPDADWRDAAALMKRAHQGLLTLHVHPVTLAEVVWVLEKAYRVPRPEVARLVEALVLSEGVWCEDRDVVTAALDDYGSGPADFPDVFLARKAAGGAAPLCYTFDRKHFGHLGASARRPGP